MRNDYDSVENFAGIASAIMKELNFLIERRNYYVRRNYGNNRRRGYESFG